MAKKRAKSKPKAATSATPVSAPGSSGRGEARAAVAHADRAAGVSDRQSTTKIKVRAIRLGYYDNERKRVGDVFFISGPREFSTVWMETVDGSVPTKTTGPQQALNRELHRVEQEKAGTGPGQGADEASAQGGASPLGE